MANGLLRSVPHPPFRRRDERSRPRQRGRLAMVEMQDPTPFGVTPLDVPEVRAKGPAASSQGSRAGSNHWER